MLLRWDIWHLSLLNWFISQHNRMILFFRNTSSFNGMVQFVSFVNKMWTACRKSVSIRVCLLNVSWLDTCSFMFISVLKHKLNDIICIYFASLFIIVMGRSLMHDNLLYIFIIRGHCAWLYRNNLDKICRH